MENSICWNLTKQDLYQFILSTTQAFKHYFTCNIVVSSLQKVILKSYLTN